MDILVKIITVQNGGFTHRALSLRQVSFLLFQSTPTRKY